MSERGLENYHRGIYQKDAKTRDIGEIPQSREAEGEILERTESKEIQKDTRETNATDALTELKR